MIKGPEALCRSYGEACASGDGVKLAGHYVYPYLSFTLGGVHSFPDRETANASCQQQVDRFERAGVGKDIRLKDFKVDQVSPDSALCHLYWEVHPTNGTPGWTWMNIYAYRRRGDEEGFEFNISDNEISELLKRFPNFFSL